MSVAGRVEAVVTRSARGTLPGEYLTLATPRGMLDVQLGPARARNAERCELRAGDEIEVTGCIITFNGKNVMLARQVKRGSQVLTLRSKRGYPIASRGAEGRASVLRVP